MTPIRSGFVLLCALTLGVGCSDSDDSSSDEGTMDSPVEGAAGDTATGDPDAPAGDGDGDSDGATGSPDGTGNADALPEDLTLPLIFVHGFAGSADQYRSQKIRFVANGYPAERIRAYDHDGAGFAFGEYVAGLGEMVDQALADFGTEQVYLVGHSRGTAVSSNYLGDASNAAKVAKYIAIDGSPCPSAVPCVAPTQAAIPGQSHVEVSTSAESFVMQYEFLIGEAPEFVDIVPQDGPVQISGRAVDFPANTGRDGTVLEIWEIDSGTGHRVGDAPTDTFEIGAEGDFGPTTVEPDRHYELALMTPGAGTQHFYFQPFVRDSNFIRLLSGDPDTSATRQNTNSGDNHAALIVMRMREWHTSDVLEIGTDSDSGTAEPVNAITSSVGNGAIALHIHDDAASPGETSLEPLPYFSTQPFQNGVDLFMPGAAEPDGTIQLVNHPRGDGDSPQTLNVPNWASGDHLITVVFSDYAQD
ncbi:MAG: alpha/beta fold hydrolase [Myxococcales bacterium]|nr:alpha/beta fold hydrolase [Myxococcales bacterium]